MDRRGSARHTENDALRRGVHRHTHAHHGRRRTDAARAQAVSGDDAGRPSGYSDFSYVSEAVRSQAVDYLLKPLTEEALSGAALTAQGTLSGAGTRTDPPQTGRAHQQGRPAQRRRKTRRTNGSALSCSAPARCRSASLRKCAPGRNSGAAGAARSRRGNHQ